MLKVAWEPGVIGDFERLSYWAQKNRQTMQDMADDPGRSALGRALAAGTLQLRDLVAGASPVDTGTLRSAHRGELEPYAFGMQGVVSIDTVIATMKPLLTHCARACPRVNCCDSPGIATLTTVEDMTEAIVPTITESSSSQR